MIGGILNLSRLRKMSFLGVVITGLVFLFCSVFPVYHDNGQKSSFLSLQPTDIEIKNLENTWFGQAGLYLTRPENPSSDNVYTGTIDASDLKKGNGMVDFHPTFTALVMKDDEWLEITDENPVFWCENSDSTYFSIRWKLKETAPAAVYGVRCDYIVKQENEEIEQSSIFRVLYTENWTYIKVCKDGNDGARRICDFVGGSSLTLSLYVTFNSGAADPRLSDTEKALSTGVKYDALKSGNVVSTDTMEIKVQTASGEMYKDFSYKIDDNVNNRVNMRFNEPLEDEIYIVQFTSKANSQIIGQFIIDNTGMNSGVNLSQLWVILMIMGGILVLGASSAYFVPLLTIKLNQARFDKETERVARLKNPDAYANSKKKTFKETVDKVIYNIKTPAYKRKKEEKTESVPTEEKVYSNRFTEMLRERQEKRDFMREHNVSSVEMEKMKEAEVEAAEYEKRSFASLRDDDDDEIATFHAAEDEISTLETGAYVEDGTRFAKLDSLRDENHGEDDDDTI